jgi:hypothetical protein
MAEYPATTFPCSEPTPADADAPRDGDPLQGRLGWDFYVGTSSSSYAIYVFEDLEAKNWGFTIPVLGITGGAKTLDKTLKRVRGAVAFALDPDPVAAKVKAIAKRRPGTLRLTPKERRHLRDVTKGKYRSCE